ncbi:hypothetical protein [Arthrobacter sp. NicSoilB8]|uniref:hypothetical protein n=1 Tax=Arthrobacter sp. NicSoilB8 TaxID=2830998 RepID=UPI001CC79BEF|nr:hypothetical protein [Arthrobacter sp. NicSoilB8]
MDKKSGATTDRVRIAKPSPPERPYVLENKRTAGVVHPHRGVLTSSYVACRHGRDVLKPDVTNPWQSLFRVAADSVAAQTEHETDEFAPHWIYRGKHKIERRLLDHPLSRDVPRTKQMLAGLAK